MLSSAATGISSFGTPVAALRTDRFTVDAR
jgi:hypothetical protein